MTMVERLCEVGSTLPQPALAELLDFAEFLRQKAKQPDVQSVPLSDLGGGLEDSLTFVGEPLSIQEKMRREWD